jgi:hypothetical protein
MTLTFELLDFSKVDYPSKCEWLPPSFEVLNRKRLTSLGEERILPTDCVQTQTSSLPWVSRLSLTP